MALTSAPSLVRTLNISSFPLKTINTFVSLPCFPRFHSHFKSCLNSIIIHAAAAQMLCCHNIFSHMNQSITLKPASFPQSVSAWVKNIILYHGITCVAPRSVCDSLLQVKPHACDCYCSLSCQHLAF